MSRRKIPFVEIALLIVSIGVFVVVTILTQSQGQNRDAYSTYDTVPAGYRALFELLEAERVSVHRFERHAIFLDPAVNTLVYAKASDYSALLAQRADADAGAVDSWLRAGGRLIYLGHPLADRVGAAIGLPDTDAPKRARAKPRIDAALRAAGVRRVDVPRDERWAHGKGITVLADDGWGPVVVSYARGAGTVVAVIDGRIFDDAELGKSDRGRLALALLRPANGAGEVWFDEGIHGHLVPEHWWSIVPVPFLYGLGVALAAFVIALAGAALRYGPPIVPPKRDDRTSADFIDAVSSLLERDGARDAAAADATSSAAGAVARSAGLDGDAPEPAVLAGLRDDGIREEYRALRRLAEQSKLDAKTFVRVVALAQRLRKDAVPHAR